MLDLLTSRHLTPCDPCRGPFELSDGLAAIGLLLALVSLASCDAPFVSPATVHPEIRLRFEQPLLLSASPGSKRGSAVSGEAAYQLVLTVTNQENEDFSPDPLTVQDTQSEARIALSLPPDNIYRFSVRFLRGTSLVAEGGAVYHVRSDSRIIDVPIVPLSSGIATVGFLPGYVRLRQDEETVDLRLRLYGTGSPVAGLACRIDVEGVDTASLQFAGADLVRAESGRLDLAWSWSPSMSSDADLGILRVPRASAGTVRLRITAGNLRSVSPDGAVSPLQAVGAVLDITP